LKFNGHINQVGRIDLNELIQIIAQPASLITHFGLQEPAVSLLIRHWSADGAVLCGFRDDEDIPWYNWP